MWAGFTRVFVFEWIGLSGVKVELWLLLKRILPETCSVFKPGFLWSHTNGCFFIWKSYSMKVLFCIYKKSQITMEQLNSIRCTIFTRTLLLCTAFFPKQKFWQFTPFSNTCGCVLSGGSGPLSSEGCYALLRVEQQWWGRAGCWKPFGRSTETQVPSQHQEGADCHPQDCPQSEQTGGSHHKWFLMKGMVKSTLLL